MSEKSENIVENSEAVAQVVEQEKYDYDSYPSILLVILLLAALGVGLFGLFFLLRTAAFPPPTYFPATDLGQLIQEAPLNQAAIQENVLLNWITEGMMDAHTFNFINYPSVMSKAQPYFTAEGYTSYQNTLTTRKIIDRVVNKKYVLKASPTDAPQILLEKPFAGRYMWKIKIPMIFRYKNVTSEDNDSVSITLIAMRVPTTQSPNGVLILKYDLEILPRGTYTR